ncbi:uncharacterized protein LOC131952106 [Physella acuta]|uniref:uncharacterized protein LOC131952106 n=1 Tax=Physella acuta TaxID=109671 RepID=UPI0027DE36C7|nr:uncharacterized protein LOC131952106 [Physella acuta]
MSAELTSRNLEKRKSILLLGREGLGKSSTGNSILGSPFFKAKNYSLPDEENSVDGVSSRWTGITVVDGISVRDKDLSDKYLALKLAVSGFKAFDLCPDGFDAVVLVLQYGVRFTKQEKDTIAVIREIFGRDVFKKWGVIVMTYGDSFQLDHDDEGSSGTIQQKFDGWRKQQVGDIKKLFEECGERCVVFNNKANDKVVRTAQLDHLKEALSCLKSDPYTRECFEYSIHALIMSYVSDIKTQIDIHIASQTEQNQPENTVAYLSDLRECLILIKDVVEILCGILNLNEDHFVVVNKNDNVVVNEKGNVVANEKDNVIVNENDNFDAVNEDDIVVVNVKDNVVVVNENDNVVESPCETRGEEKFEFVDLKDTLDVNEAAAGVPPNEKQKWMEILQLVNQFISECNSQINNIPSYFSWEFLWHCYNYIFNTIGSLYNKLKCMGLRYTN